MDLGSMEGKQHKACNTKEVLWELGQAIQVEGKVGTQKERTGRAECVQEMATYFGWNTKYALKLLGGQPEI